MGSCQTSAVNGGGVSIQLVSPTSGEYPVPDTGTEQRAPGVSIQLVSPTSGERKITGTIVLTMTVSIQLVSPTSGEEELSGPANNARFTNLSIQLVSPTSGESTRLAIREASVAHIKFPFN